MSATSFISEDYLLKHYIHEIEHVFKIRYKDYLGQFKKIQQDPVIDPMEKMKQLRVVSWKTFQLRFMIHLYLCILNGDNRGFITSCYIHHNVFQLDDFLTPEKREKHSFLIKRHEQAMRRLLQHIWEKIYSDINYHIYIFYNHL